MQAIKFDWHQSTKVGMLDHLVFVCGVQNIQLNIGLPQELDPQDIFHIIKLIKFDQIILIEVHIS